MFSMTNCFYGCSKRVMALRFRAFQQRIRDVLQDRLARSSHFEKFGKYFSLALIWDYVLQMTLLWESVRLDPSFLRELKFPPHLAIEKNDLSTLACLFLCHWWLKAHILRHISFSSRIPQIVSKTLQDYQATDISIMQISHHFQPSYSKIAMHNSKPLEFT